MKSVSHKTSFSRKFGRTPSILVHKKYNINYYKYLTTYAVVSASGHHTNFYYLTTALETYSKHRKPKLNQKLNLFRALPNSTDKCRVKQRSAGTFEVHLTDHKLTHLKRWCRENRNHFSKFPIQTYAFLNQARVA